MSGPLDFAFIAPNPVHSVGFERIASRYALVVFRHSALTRELEHRGARVIEAARDADGDLTHSADTLLDLPATASAVREADLHHVLLFKDSARTEAAAKAIGCDVLTAPPAIARRLENKLNTREVALRAGVSVPESRVVTLQPGTYDELAGVLGEAFVLQAAKSFGGAHTYRVRSLDEFEHVAETNAGRKMRASQLIAGDTITINGCVTRDGIAIGAPAYQITGLPECTPHTLGSCGNDLTFGDPERMRAIAEEPARRIGQALAEEGYLGVFGLDFVLDGERPLLVDLNPRLTASLALHTALSLGTGTTSLAELHVRTHFGESGLELPPTSSAASLGEASSLIVYNTLPVPVLPPAEALGGVWNLGAMRCVRGGVDVTDLTGPSEALVCPAEPGRHVKPGAEAARVYFRSSIMAAPGRLKPEASAVVARLRELLAPA